MDGIETASLMQSNVHTQNIPIIFLTAYDKDEINMLQGYKVGAIDYLFKPFNEEILSSKVATFLRSYSFEKEKEYERLLSELEIKNENLKTARKDAVRMMKDANKAKRQAQMSQKQVENQAKDLMKYTKELEQFAYVATHDLRAPILNLNGILDIFKKRGYVTRENQAIVHRIDGSVKRINATLHDLIRVVAYRNTLDDEAKEQYFEQVFTDIKKDISFQIEEAGAKISSDFREAPKINYIPGHLRSILLNLMTNAIKFHSTKRPPVISVRTSLEKKHLCLQVKDNGIGIDESKKEKVFGLFQRLTTSAPGNGMGLYITKSLVEAMGGTIDFNSQPEKGTEFKVLLKQVTNSKN